MEFVTGYHLRKEEIACRIGRLTAFQITKREERLMLRLLNNNLHGSAFTVTVTLPVKMISQM
uniref:Uncharacterized protein n=1 Tax=Catagonus wagneri TaxID=51154 RepID=A0A8C3YS34_9CETA